MRQMEQARGREPRPVDATASRQKKRRSPPYWRAGRITVNPRILDDLKAEEASANTAPAQSFPHEIAMAFARILLSLLVLAGASALQLQPMARVAAVGASPLRVTAAPRCQFGQKPDTEQKGLSRDSEPEEFFTSDWGARSLPPAPA